MAATNIEHNPMLSHPPEWAGMEDERRLAILAGETAMSDLRGGFDDWVRVGRAFHEIQLEAMARSNSNQPNGRRYADAYNLLEKPTEQLKSFDKSDRKKVVDLYLDRLQHWLAPRRARIPALAAKMGAAAD